MSSLTNTQVNARSMNGLVNVEANSGTFDEIDCNTLNVALSATAPTSSFGDNTTNIATTQFVQSAVSSIGGVSLGGNNVFTGDNTFTGAVEVGPATLTAVDINVSGLIDTQDVYIHGLLNVGTVVINETGTGDLQLNNPTNGGKYILKADDTGGVSREALNLSASTATFNGTIVASGATFNTALPTSTISATTSTELVNKATLDSAISTAGSSYVNLSGTQTITGDKTFTGGADFLSLSASYISNTSSIDTPSIGSGLGSDSLNVGANQTSGVLFLGCRTNRTGAINIGTLATGNAPIVIGSTASTTQTATHNTITTFNKIPLCSGVPATGDHLTNKTYVDGAISTAGTGFMSLTGTQTASGQKTFSNANTYISGNTITNNLKSTSGSLNISTNSASVVDNINITTGANMFLDCGLSGIGKIYLTKDGGACMSIDDAGAIFNVDVDFFGQTTIDPFTVFNMMPTATIIQNASSVVPSGFLYCDGTAVSRTTYSTLFNRLGTTYGPGNGSTTFNLPNYKGAFLRGASSQVVGGITYAGGTVGTAQQDSVLALSTISNQGYYNVDAGGGGSSRQLKSRTRIGTDPVDTGAGIDASFPRQNTTENRPFNHAIYYYIRY